MVWAQHVSTIDADFATWAAGLGWPVEGLFRLAVAAVAGGLVGLEREVRGRQAGFRTYILVCFGSALAMIISTHFATHHWDHTPGININVDPARIAYGVMTGIGFIGAGTIVHQKGTVRGLTTAAGIWCIAAVGLAAGFGLYLLTILSAFSLMVVLWLLDYLEDAIPKTRYRTVTLRVKWVPGCVAAMVDRFKASGLHVIDANFERTNNLEVADISLRIAFINSKQYYNLERQLEGDSSYMLMATREL